MAGLSMHHPLAFIFGVLGNIISFMVYLAPLPTFYRVYRKKSTQDFQSVPYIVALFSAMLWIYYALVKTDSALLISINSVGCFIETIYIIIYLIYSPRKARITTLASLFILNVVVFSLIILFTLLLATGSDREKILGWICVGFSVCVFAAPLSIIRLVIRTKSVEFMPFSLSLFLTISAVVWFLYGLFTKDLYVQLPNVLGFSFGVFQMLLYWCYKNKKTIVEPMLPENFMELPTKIAAIVVLSPGPILEVCKIVHGDAEILGEISDGKEENKAEKDSKEDKEMNIV
ncbi:bidirectional sugar transporter SWEET14-like [Typha latifolia]|uniref:bidirectional sugar transporter SWEET14-like n=1 Tax=Typha latifolia TaxID=4733 RepID=UPI003C2C53A6